MSFINVMYGLFGFILMGKPCKGIKGIPLLVILSLSSSFLVSCNPQAELGANPISGLAPLSVTFDASSSTVTYGDIASYEWDFDGDGTTDASGSDLTKVRHTYGKSGVYEARLTVRDNWGFTSTATVDVTVDANPNDVLESYGDLIPANSTASYRPKCFAVITGKVRDAESNPLEGVRVRVHDRTEAGKRYGSSVTDGEGRFSLPVNGGLTFTIVYEKDGYLCVHRKVKVPWNDVAVAGTVYMSKQDIKETTITLGADSIQRHVASTQDDASGERTCSIVFPQDLEAYETRLSQDNTEQDVRQLQGEIVVTATEYTVGPNGPKAMPCELPPSVAYTYCVELRAEQDGMPIDRLRFTKPVVVWVDNFLDMPVGQGIPVGYYDRQRALWVGLRDGLVVRLLDTDGDGIVDALDATGDSEPDDLDGDGAYNDEVEGLGDADRYPPGATFWRVEVSHFSVLDFNWPWGLPGDAIVYNPLWKVGADAGSQKDEYCGVQVDSRVNERDLSYHEDIPIAGTELKLHYSSSRVDAFRHIIRIPLTSDTIPTSLEKIIVKVDIEGKRLKKEVEAPFTTNQYTQIVWDGKDYRGRRVYGPVNAHLSIGYAYRPYYYSVNGDLYIAGRYYRSWEKAGRFAMDIQGRDLAIAWWRQDIKIETRPKDALAEGWTISVHHSLNPHDPSVLYKGDGDVVKDRTSVMYRYAGLGGPSAKGYNGDSNPQTGELKRATDALLYWPAYIALDGTGNLYIADTNNDRIRKVDTNGYIWTVAGGGNGSPYEVGDGGPATDAFLCRPSSVTLDNAGNIYIADACNYRIRKVDTSGIITTVLGRLTETDACIQGDGGPAKDAIMCDCRSLVTDNMGNIYFTDRYRVRKINTSGIVNTVAFGGNYNGGNPQGPDFIDPKDITTDDQGNVYILSMGNIKKLGIDGKLSNYFVCSSDKPLCYGMNSSHGLCMDKLGNLYVAAFFYVTKIDKNKVLSIIAGSGGSGYSAEGGMPTEVPINGGYGIAVDPSGDMYVSDMRNNCVWKIVKSLAAFSGRDGGDITFVEGGLGYVMDSYGRHKKTTYLDTGTVLWSFGYDDEGKLTSITDRFGECTTIQASGSSIDITAHSGSPDQVTTRLTLNDEGQISMVTYPDQGYYSFQYTDDGLMTDEWDPNGNHFVHNFDKDGRVVSVSDDITGEDHPWMFESHLEPENGMINILVTSPQGNTTTYNDKHYVTGRFESLITGPGGDITSYLRTADLAHVEKQDPCGLGLRFLYAFDKRYHYRYMRKMEEITGGKVRTSTWDKDYKDTNNDNNVDMVTTRVTTNQKVTTMENDIENHVKTLITPQGRHIVMTYDPVTLLPVSVEIPGMQAISYEYDLRGRPTVVSSGDRSISLSYMDSASGHDVNITDALGRKSTYYYDIMGRLYQVNRPDGTSVGFTYDANGNMTILRTPSSIEHLFGYNAVNLIGLYQAPVSGSYTYTYNRDRELTSLSLPSGRRIDNIYENARLVRVETPEGNIDIDYLCSSKPSSITRGEQGIAYGYNGALLTSETISGTLDQAIGFSYDNDFRISSISYAGYTMALTYDDDGLLTGLGDFSIARDAGNGLACEVGDGTVRQASTYDGYGEVLSKGFSINGNTIYYWSLTFNNAGRITQKTETTGESTSTYEYTYDQMGRLLSVTRDGSLVEEYRYGPNGTRIHEINIQKGIQGRDLSYSDEDQVLTAGDTTYAYDADGFLKIKTNGTDTTTYTYSTLGELLEVDLPDGREIEYIYDPLGRRIAKKVNGVITEKYLWQGYSRLLAVYDGNDNLKMRFLYADGRMPVAFEISGNRYYLCYDQVGSLRLVTDDSGNVQRQIDYDAFGYEINDTNPGFWTPFGFAGGLFDRDTGLVHFGFRDYDPDIGRWTAKDPLLFAGSETDLYGYCLNDGVNYIDPSGQLLGTAAVGFIAGAYSGFLSGIQSGNLGAGIIAGMAGAGAGMIVGTILPSASSVIGGMVGGAIASAIGGAVGGVTSAVLNSNPCRSARDIAAVTAKCAEIGAITGALGSGLTSIAAGVGAGRIVVDIGIANITTPLGWGLGLDWQKY